jgi:hypothetical protein
MKQREYTEGPKALENVERLATAVMQPAKPTKKEKQKDKPVASLKETKIFRQGLEGDLLIPRPCRRRVERNPCACQLVQDVNRNG